MRWRLGLLAGGWFVAGAVVALGLNVSSETLFHAEMVGIMKSFEHQSGELLKAHQQMLRITEEQEVRRLRALLPVQIPEYPTKRWGKK